MDEKLNKEVNEILEEKRAKLKDIKNVAIIKKVTKTESVANKKEIVNNEKIKIKKTFKKTKKNDIFPEVIFEEPPEEYFVEEKKEVIKKDEKKNDEFWDFYNKN